MKELDLAGGYEAMTLAVRHLVSEVVPGKVSIEYDTVLGSLQGDWYTAADIYGAWAHDQWWCETKWMDRAGVADWARQWPSMVKLDRYKEDTKDTPETPYRSLATVSVRIYGPYQSYEPEPTMLDFYCRAHTAARTYAYDYVMRGRMIRPLPAKTPELEISYW